MKPKSILYNVQWASTTSRTFSFKVLVYLSTRVLEYPFIRILIEFPHLYAGVCSWSRCLSTEWAKKVICCIAGCNFVNYGPIFKSTVRKLTKLPERYVALFATYLQNVTTLPCKMANSVRAHLEFCKSRVKHSDRHEHRIVNCVEQLTVN